MIKIIVNNYYKYIYNSKRCQTIQNMFKLMEQLLPKQQKICNTVPC